MILQRNKIQDIKLSSLTKISLKELKAYILSIFLFISFLPWFVWKIYPIVLVLCFGLYLYLFASSGRFEARKESIIFIIIIFIYFSVIRINQNFNGWLLINISLFTLFLIRFEDNEVKKDAFKKFAKLTGFILIPGIVIFLGLNIFNIPDLGLIKGRSIAADSYQNFFFYIKYSDPHYKIFPRFNSIYDEPGVLGNICVFILYFLNFDLKRWYGKVIFVAGILSLSLFFYLSAVLLLFIKRITKIKHILILCLFLALFYSVTRKNELFNKYLYKRVEITKDNKLAGNNRTTAKWDVFYRDFLKTDSKYFGVLGLDKKSNKNYTWVSSYQIFIYNYGIIGLILICIYYYYSFKSEINLFMALSTMLLFILAIYQRPFILEYNYYALIFFCGVAYLRQDIITNKRTPKFNSLYAD
jgi:hypothetical protein